MVEPKIFIEEVNYFYGDFHALRNITLEVPPRSVTVFFGPAAGGKTTLLRLINRLNDMIDDTRMTGRVLLDGKNVYDPGTNVESLRRRVGMVFALPLPLPGT
ncbi:MAG TPA: ATP-binding cassette domain-containing protein, partial [Deltaproteobacteria bacterium]|nr:ATP-binding cassette domain-containing protein [Deltaproteobacteria bacterium]